MVSSRFYRWQKAAVWGRVLAEVQRQATAAGRLDWSPHFVDSTVVRAHQHSAGAKGGTQRPRASAAAAATLLRKFTFGASGTASQWC